MHTKITYCDEEEEACPITGSPRPRIYSSFSTEKKHKFLKNILSLQPNWQGKMVVELMTKEKIFILDPFMVIILYGETTIKELCCRLLFLLIELQKYTMYKIWPLQILSCHSIYQYLLQFIVGWLFALGLDVFKWDQKVNPIYIEDIMRQMSYLFKDGQTNNHNEKISSWLWVVTLVKAWSNWYVQLDHKLNLENHINIRHTKLSLLLKNFTF